MAEDVQIPLGAWDGKGWDCHAAGADGATLRHLHVDNATPTSWTSDKARRRILWTGDAPPKEPGEAYATFVFESAAQPKLPIPVVVAMITVAGAIAGALISAMTSTCPGKLETERDRAKSLEEARGTIEKERDFTAHELKEVTRLCNTPAVAGNEPR